MRLESSETGGIQVIRVREPRIDAAVVIRFKEEARALVSNRAPRVVLDLSEVNFLDSSGLGAVVAVMKHVGPERKLELAGLTPTVEKVFRLTRMDSIFTIHPSAWTDRLRNAG